MFQRIFLFFQLFEWVYIHSLEEFELFTLSVPNIPPPSAFPILAEDPKSPGKSLPSAYSDQQYPVDLNVNSFSSSATVSSPHTLSTYKRPFAIPVWSDRILPRDKHSAFEGDKRFREKSGSHTDGKKHTREEENAGKGWIAGVFIEIHGVAHFSA